MHSAISSKQIQLNANSVYGDASTTSLIFLVANLYDRNNFKIYFKQEEAIEEKLFQTFDPVGINFKI